MEQQRGRYRHVHKIWNRAKFKISNQPVASNNVGGAPQFRTCNRVHVPPRTQAAHVFLADPTTLYRYCNNTPLMLPVYQPLGKNTMTEYTCLLSPCFSYSTTSNKNWEGRRYGIHTPLLSHPLPCRQKNLGRNGITHPSQFEHEVFYHPGRLRYHSLPPPVTKLPRVKILEIQECCHLRVVSHDLHNGTHGSMDMTLKKDLKFNSFKKSLEPTTEYRVQNMQG